MTTELETLYATVVIFGLLSALIYTCILRPFLPSEHAPANVGDNFQHTDPRLTTPATANSTATAAPSAGTPARAPSHVSKAGLLVARADGRNLLQDNGIIVWKYTTSAGYESKEIDNKERVRLLSRLLLSSPPPLKGSTLVLSIPGRDVGCVRLRRALYLLATYYNLIVLLVVTPDFNATKEKAALIRKLRGENSDGDNDDDAAELPIDVLPDHRVVLSCTAAGRVAFCRQLHRIELVLDYDEEVRDMLARFGHRVTLYGEGFSANGGSDQGMDTTSLLGRVLSS